MPKKQTIYTKGETVHDKISGENVTIYCREKSGEYYVDIPGIEHVLYRRTEELSAAKKTKKQ